MTKHTAADFAAARFAEHPDGRIAMRDLPGAIHPWKGASGRNMSDQDMVAEGWRIVTPALDPSDPDVIEQAAERAYEARWHELEEELGGETVAPWRNLPDRSKEGWRNAARAALTPPPARDPEVRGIDDTSRGRCEAPLNIKGEHFQCDLAVEHDGWAHTSKAAGAIWGGRDTSPPEPARDPEAVKLRVLINEWSMLAEPRPGLHEWLASRGVRVGGGKDA